MSRTIQWVDDGSGMGEAVVLAGEVAGVMTPPHSLGRMTLRQAHSLAIRRGATFDPTTSPAGMIENVVIDEFTKNIEEQAVMLRKNAEHGHWGAARVSMSSLIGLLNGLKAELNHETDR